MKLFNILTSFAALVAISTQVNAAGSCCGADHASSDAAVIQPAKVDKAVFQSASALPEVQVISCTMGTMAAVPTSSGCGSCGDGKKDDGKTKAASIIPASAGCGGCGGDKKDDGKIKAASMAPAACPASVIMQAAVMAPASASCDDNDKDCGDKKACATGLQSAEVAPEADANSEVAVR